MDRALTAARMYTVHPTQSLGIPWLVVASSFIINLPIWALTDASEQPGGGTTGGVAALYIAVLVVFSGGATQLLPIAMGLSLTRRAFFTGSAIAAATLSLGFGLILTALDVIENSTGGWGVGLNFFAPGRMDVDNVVLQVLVFAAPLFLAAALGAALGIAYKRWGASGLWLILIGLTLALGALAVLVTWREAWGDIGSWVMAQPIAVLAIAIPMLGALVTALLASAGLRRLVP